MTVLNATDWGESDGECFGRTIQLLEDIATVEPDHLMQVIVKMDCMNKGRAYSLLPWYLKKLAESRDVLKFVFPFRSRYLQ